MSNSPNNYSMEEIQRMAQSEAGQRLFAYLQQTQGQKLQTAMDGAAAGDYRQVKQALAEMMRSPEAMTLLEQLRGRTDG